MTSEVMLVLAEVGYVYVQICLIANLLYDLTSIELESILPH
jgi:hypothetical protein